mmetsp:Transcript_26581/g.31374  ORF Transcript_26581/g.31374 Transcript_26581/m.31374 type:complete len:170 (-) Transcript_26581:153-662(-)
MSDTESYDASLTSQESWVDIQLPQETGCENDDFLESCSDLTDLDLDSLSISSDTTSIDSFSQAPVIKHAKLSVPKKIRILRSADVDIDSPSRHRTRLGRRKQRRAENDAMASISASLLDSGDGPRISLSVFPIPEYSTNFDTLFENPDLFRRFSSGYNTMKKKKNKEVQ